MNRFLPLLFLLATSAASLAHAANPDFDRFINDLADDIVRRSPGLATSSQYFSGAEQDALDRSLTAGDQWGPLSPVRRVQRLESTRRSLEQLRRFPPSELSPRQRITRGMLEWKLQDVARTTEFADQSYIFDQMFGQQIGVVNLLTVTHSIRHARDIENYLARLQRVAPVIDEGIAEAHARAVAGVIPPTFIVKSTIEGLDRFLADPPAKNIFVTSLSQRAALLTSLPPDTLTAALASAEKIVGDEVIPAFRRVRALLAGQMATATDVAGYAKHPRGTAAYTAVLASYTTTALTAEEVHAIGLREVARIEARMDQLLRARGFSDGSVNERYQKFNATLLPPADPDPRPALIARYTEIVRDGERRAAALFDLRPKAPIEVRRVPPFTESNAAAHYTRPAPDGSRPGIFWAPLAHLTPDVLWLGAGMKTVAYHEAVPGHHFQLTLQQELPEIPRFQQKGVLGAFTAFSEGWALYAERLAAEFGWYDDDPSGLLGQLQGELFRARRLVVDTGLHVKGWTRQQAIDYGIQPSEVERYVANPGQACAYLIGQLEILSLRARAQQALGGKFSIKEFHNVLLRTGTVPLAVLNEVVDEWIMAEKTKN